MVQLLGDEETWLNETGVKTTLSFGGFGYFIYVASFLSYNHNQNAGFNIFAGKLPSRVCFEYAQHADS